VRRPLKISGDADRFEQKRGVDDDYIHPGNLFRLMPPDEQQRTIAAIVGSLSKVPVEVPKKMVEHFTRVDPDHGGGITKGLSLA
jgi:catalase